MFAHDQPDVGMMNEVMFQQTKARDIPLPNSYDAAMSDPNWRKAIEKEQKAMIDREVFSLIPLPTGVRR